MTNLNDLNDIRYAPITTGANQGPQTMFFYINNTPVKITQATGKGADSFVIADIKEVAAIMNTGGTYKLRLVYKGKKNTYENTVTIFLNQTNLPTIPAAPGTIYPYSSDLISPLANDPNFPKKGSVYTTKEPYMNIYGTFDFLDLGSKGATLDEVSNALSGLDLPANLYATLSKYILRIDSTGFDGASIIWNLNNELRVINSSLSKESQVLGTLNPTNPVTKIPKQGEKQPKLTVTYDVQTQAFSWVLTDQYLSKDGSPSVYNFYVYNNGEAGARAGYRMEVDPTSLPYKIFRPLNAKRTVNQNYVEVIIDAPSADTVTVNKLPAEKIAYDADNDGTIDYTTAYRVMVSGLKAGNNTLKFTIANKSDTINGYDCHQLCPTSIPGAGYMETMKNSHKVFEGQVS